MDTGGGITKLLDEIILQLLHSKCFRNGREIKGAFAKLIEKLE